MLTFDGVKSINQLYARALGGIEACVVRGDMECIRTILENMNKREAEIKQELLKMGV